MAAAKCTDQEFIELLRNTGNRHEVARILDTSPRSIYKRLRRMEDKYNIALNSDQPNAQKWKAETSFERVHLSVQDGYVLIPSDAHYVPGQPPSTAHRALLWLCKELKPKAVIYNGDMFDFPQISRHHRIGWQRHPTVKEELEEVQNRLQEIEKLAVGATFIRTWGNHDLRFEGKLSNILPQYEGISGMALKDHLPRWKPCWAVRINDNQVEVKHRWKSGKHAPYLHAQQSGVKVYVTGHQHAQKIEPYSNLTSTAYGVDCGTMAEPDWEQEQFNYLEMNPVDWRSGFCVLRFIDGEIMPPELVRVISPGKVWFGVNLFNV